MNNKTSVVLRKFSFALTIISLALAAAGTVLMFFAKLSSMYFYYIGSNKYYFLGNLPEAGIMPLFGTLCLIAAFVCTIASKKSPNAAIGAMISIAFAEVLLITSVVMLDGVYNEEPWIGYWLCIGAACLMFCVFWLMLLYRIFVSRAQTEAEKEKRSHTGYAKRLYQAADVLRELKALYDNGIFTQAEYIRAKREAIERFEVYPIKETPAHPPQQ